MFPSSLPSVASAPVVHQSPRNVTFHYRRSSAAYFGGMCSVSRGVGVNEVRRCPSSLCLHAIVVTCVWTMCFFFVFVCLLCCCSPQYGNNLAMAGALSQSLAQNLGIQWDPASKKSTHETHAVDFYINSGPFWKSALSDVTKGTTLRLITTPSARFLFAWVRSSWFFPLPHTCVRFKWVLKKFSSIFDEGCNQGAKYAIFQWFKELIHHEKGLILDP